VLTKTVPKRDRANVERKNADFLKLFTQIERQIETLVAYRKSLIHECVTGQRRVTESNVSRAVGSSATERKVETHGA
jgi:hypothetical protein